MSTSRTFCLRCKEIDSLFVVRGDSICRNCYNKYIRNKFVKRLDNFRARTGPVDVSIPNVLLALSLGVASTSLLHLLDGHLNYQRQKFKAAYNLVIVYIDESAIETGRATERDLNALIQRYSEAGRYLVAFLEDIYEFWDDGRALKGAALENCMTTLDIRGTKRRKRLQELLSAIPSASSRSDLACIIRNRLIVEIAKREKCATIMWGDTTTRMAEKTLAETAKGRGFSLPWQVTDGPSVFDIKYMYPLRDLFKKELVTFVSFIIEPPILPFCISYSAKPKHSVASATSGRNITVDELMTQYFDNMENQYPSIVSNVMRTAGRLKVADRGSQPCRICGFSGYDGGGKFILGPEATLENTQDHVDQVESSKICYACLRATHSAKNYHWPWPGPGKPEGTG